MIKGVVYINAIVSSMFIPVLMLFSLVFLAIAKPDALKKAYNRFCLTAFVLFLPYTYITPINYICLHHKSVLLKYER